MFAPKKLLAIVAASMALGLTAGMVHAAEPLTPYTGELPPILKFAKSSNTLQVFKKFEAAKGLDGWVVKDNSSGKDIVIYTTQDGTAMLAGMMIDMTGKNLTAEFLAEHVPAPDYGPAFADFNGAPSVLIGSAKAKAEVTVAFDPNCSFCKLFHRLTAPAVDAGELRVRIVPVAILGADSDVKAAGILNSKNPRAEVDAAVAGRGGAKSSDKDLLAKVQGNTNLMRKHGFGGTPTVMYSAKDKGEDTIFISNGVPNMNEFFARLGIDGKVDELRKDPALARYVQ